MSAICADYEVSTSVAIVQLGLYTVLRTLCIVWLDCPANVGLVERIHCRVRDGGLRSPKESGVALDRQREVCGMFR